MKHWKCLGLIIAIYLFAGAAHVGAENFTERFGEGTTSVGIQAGFGYTIDLPPGRDRTDLGFLFLFPNYKYNLTGIVGESFYQGALYWHVEAGLAQVMNRDGEYLVGFSPLMVDYKFLSPSRNWAPNILLGGGFAFTNWKDVAVRELGSEFQFILNIGGGIEFFRDTGSYSLNYRLFHVSNAGIQFPNIGLNSHVFSLGFQF